MSFFDSYAKQLTEELNNIPFDDISRLAEVLTDARDSGRSVYTMGNGGSSAAASHLVNDLVKGSYGSDGRRFRAYCLSDNVPLLTAFGNDDSYETVFSRQIECYVKPGDIVIAISGSGNSPNILHGLHRARECGATTASILGFGGGKAAELSDLAVILPSDNMQRVEDLHVIVGHMLMAFFVSQRD